MKSLAPLPLGDVATLNACDATLAVAPQCGARLLSFDIAGKHILRPLSEAARKKLAPYEFAGFPLLPYSGPIFGGSFAFEGETYHVGRTTAAEGDAVHGDAWTRSWSIASRAESTLTLDLTYEPTENAFPFRWTGRLTYALEPHALNIRMTITNADSRALPAGMGFHPYFPRPPGTRLQFAHGGVWPPDSPEAVTGEPGWIDGLDFNAGQDVTDLVVDRCFENWPGTCRVSYPDGSDVTITASPAFGKMQIYLPWRDPFMCVEPVSNTNDGFNRARHGVLRHGVVRLAPGQCLSGTIRIASGTSYGADGPG